MANVPRLQGEVIEGKRFAKFVVDFLESLAGGVSTATATAEAAAAIASVPPTTISGDGVTGSPETGYVISHPESGLTLGQALQLPNLVNFY